MTISNNNVCAWCGQSTTEEYCSTACETASVQAYHEDMSEMVQPSLMEVHGDTPMEVCPVCEERPVSNGLSTCLASDCKDQWSIAMAWQG